MSAAVGQIERSLASTEGLWRWLNAASNNLEHKRFSMRRTSVERLRHHEIQASREWRRRNETPDHPRAAVFLISFRNVADDRKILGGMGLPDLDRNKNAHPDGARYGQHDLPEGQPMRRE